MTYTSSNVNSVKSRRPKNETIKTEQFLPNIITVNKYLHSRLVPYNPPFPNKCWNISRQTFEPYAKKNTGDQFRPIAHRSFTYHRHKSTRWNPPRATNRTHMCRRNASSPKLDMCVRSQSASIDVSTFRVPYGHMCAYSKNKRFFCLRRNEKPRWARGECVIRYVCELGLLNCAFPL